MGVTVGKDLLKLIGSGEGPDLHYKLKMKSSSSEAIMGAAAGAATDTAA